MKPLFSIITVTYNAEKTLLPTLLSVKEQTFVDYEHLIMDGSSTDSTTALAESCGNSRLKIFSEPDSGLYHAMNKGIDKATGKYLVFLNAGDSFHSPSTLQTIADAIICNSYPGIVYGQTDVVNSYREKLADRHLVAPESLTYKSFANGMVVCHQAFVVLAQIAPQFNLRYRYSADYEWCILCLQHSRNNVYIPHAIIDYLFEGLTTANRKRSLVERFRIMAKYYGTIPTIIRHFTFLPRFFARNRKERSFTK